MPGFLDMKWAKPEAIVQKVSFKPILLDFSINNGQTALIVFQSFGLFDLTIGGHRTQATVMKVVFEAMSYLDR